MRCQSCEDHGFHDYRFCSCCGRPLTERDISVPPGVEHRSARCGRGTLGLPVAEVGALALVADAMSAGPVSTAPGRCECCGAPWAGAGTLCDGCGRVFGHVLDAVHAEGGHAGALAPVANAAVRTVERHADTGPQEADGDPRDGEADPRAVDASPHAADDGTREALEGLGDEGDHPRAVDAGSVSGHHSPIDEDTEAAARASAWWNLPPVPPPSPESPVPATVSPASPPARASRDRDELRTPAPAASVEPRAAHPQAGLVAPAALPIRANRERDQSPPPVPAASEPRAARPQAGPASAALLTRAARGEVRRRWLAGLRRRPHRAAKVAAGCGGLVVLLLLGVPAVQTPWSAHVSVVRAGAEPPAPAAESLAASGTVAGTVPPSHLLSAAVAPMAAVQAPVGAAPQQGLRRDTPVSRSAKANTKAKNTPARKPVKNEPVAEAPAPVVVPERFVPLPMQAPPAVTGIGVRAAIGQTYEPGQVDVRPRVESQVAASVPAHLRSRQLKEVVVLRVRVSASGRTSDVQMLRKSAVDATLDSAAVAAVKQWRFSPARRRGEAVNCWLNVGVPFRTAEDDGAR